MKSTLGILNSDWTVHDVVSPKDGIESLSDGLPMMRYRASAWLARLISLWVKPSLFPSTVLIKVNHLVHHLILVVDNWLYCIDINLSHTLQIS